MSRRGMVSRRLARGVVAVLLAVLIGGSSAALARSHTVTTLRVTVDPPDAAAGETLTITIYACTYPRERGLDLGADGVPGGDKDDCRRARRATVSANRVVKLNKKRGAVIVATIRRPGTLRLKAAIPGATLELTRPVGSRRATDTRPQQDSQTGPAERPTDAVVLDMTIDDVTVSDPRLPADADVVIEGWLCPLDEDGRPLLGADDVPSGPPDDDCERIELEYTVSGPPGEPVAAVDPAAGAATTLRTLAPGVFGLIAVPLDASTGQPTSRTFEVVEETPPARGRLRFVDGRSGEDVEAIPLLTREQTLAIEEHRREIARAEAEIETIVPPGVPAMLTRDDEDRLAELEEEIDDHRRQIADLIGPDQRVRLVADLDTDRANGLSTPARETLVATLVSRSSSGEILGKARIGVDTVGGEPVPGPTVAFAPVPAPGATDTPPECEVCGDDVADEGGSLCAFCKSEEEDFGGAIDLSGLTDGEIAMLMGASPRGMVEARAQGFTPGGATFDEDVLVIRGPDVGGSDAFEPGTALNDLWRNGQAGSTPPATTFVKDAWGEAFARDASIQAADAVLSREGLTGPVLAVATDRSDDVVACGSTDIVSGRPAFDIAWATAQQALDGSITSAVGTYGDPLASLESEWSLGGLLTVYIPGQPPIRVALDHHAGDTRAGLVDEAGQIVASDDARIVITQDGFIANVTYEGPTPAAYVWQTSNTPAEGDARSCDTLVAATFPSTFPLPEGPPADAIETCTASDTVACLANGRFRATATSGSDTLRVSAVAADPSTAVIWGVGDRDDPLFLLRILDGCDVNGHYWVLTDSATTTTTYSLTLTNVVTGESKTFTNPLFSAPRQDINAFSTCP